jgi:hypothetical protein
LITRVVDQEITFILLKTLKTMLFGQKITFMKFSREKRDVWQTFEIISSMFLGRQPNDKLPKMFKVLKLCQCKS